MPFIVVGLAFRQARAQGQDGSGAIQRLNLALLIDAQHQGSIRVMDIEAHHIADLLFKLGIVGNLKLLHPVRLHVVALPNPVHHHAGNAQLPSQLAHTPGGGIGGSRLQRGLQDLLFQLRRKHPSRPLAFLGLAEGCAAAERKSRARGQNGGARQPGLLCDRVVGHPLARQQNRLALAGHPLRRSASPSPRLQLSFLRFIDHKSSGAGEHAPIRSRNRPIVNN